MIHIPRAVTPQFEQLVEHLHTLGPRATAGALAQIANLIGGLPAIMAVLNDFRSLRPAALKALGVDRFSVRPKHLEPLQ